MEIKVKSLDEALVRLGRYLLENGVLRRTRGFDCIEAPEPVQMILENPSNRVIFNKERKWNKTLGFAETLWILNGINDLRLPGSIVKNLYNFSDDGVTMRAGYGPRIRGFNSDLDDYEYHVPKERDDGVDQLKYVIDVLKHDINSRQAGITIHDPIKDDFDFEGNLKQTMDIPCTRLLHFQVVNNKLDLTVFLRSNDLIWGLSAVNVFNFTMIQEIVSLILGIPIGRYIHIVNNLHFYENHRELLTRIVNEGYEDYEPFIYTDVFDSLESMDEISSSVYQNALHGEYPVFSEYPILNDISLALNLKFTNRKLNESGYKFTNPIFNKLYK